MAGSRRIASYQPAQNMALSLCACRLVFRLPCERPPCRPRSRIPTRIIPDSCGLVLFGAVLLAAIAVGGDSRADTTNSPPYRLEADVSMRSIPVDVRFSGARIVMFGSADPVNQQAGDARPVDIVAVIQGVRSQLTVRRKSNVWGLWINTKSVAFEQAPRYYAVASTGPLESIAATGVLAELGIGFEQIPISSAFGGAAGTKPALLQEFRQAAIELGARKKRYVRNDRGIRFVGTSLFRGQIDLPANIPVGPLEVSVFLFRGGELIARTDSHVNLVREGFEQFIYQFANQHSFLYGLFTVVLAAGIGVVSSFFAQLRRLGG